MREIKFRVWDGVIEQLTDMGGFEPVVQSKDIKKPLVKRRQYSPLNSKLTMPAKAQYKNITKGNHEYNSLVSIQHKEKLEEQEKNH